MSTPIAVVLDDVGLDPRIDDAALSLACSGRISGMSCMTGQRGWPEAAARLRTLQPGSVDIGLHLDLTERPLMLATRPLTHWVLQAAVRRLDTRSLRAEIRAQLDAFEQALGRPVDHVDGHQHVHQLPVIREALLAELAERGPRRPWLRHTAAAQIPGQPWRDAAKAQVIAGLGSAGLSARARVRGHALNGRLLGVHGFDLDERGFLQRLRGWLLAAQPADLLMTHAACALVPRDVLGSCRPSEFGALAGPAWPQLLAEAGCTVQPMTRILATGQASAPPSTSAPAVHG